MSAPFLTSRQAPLDFSRCESATEVADAFQLAVNQIEEGAKKENLRPVWGDAKAEFPEVQRIFDYDGLFLIVPMIGEK